MTTIKKFSLEISIKFLYELLYSIALFGGLYYGVCLRDYKMGYELLSIAVPLIYFLKK